MTARQTLAIALALAGFAAWALLAKRAFDSPNTTFRLDHTQARQTSAAVVKELWGDDISTWSMKVEPAMRQRYALRMWQERHARTDLDYLLIAESLRLSFSDPAKRRDYTVFLSANGRVSEVEARIRRDSRKGEGSAAAADAIAQKAVRLLTGGFANQFRPDEQATTKGRDYRWKADTSHPSLDWNLEVKFEKDTLRSAKLSARIDETARRRLLQSVSLLGDTALVVVSVFITTGACIVVVIFLFSWMQKLVDRPAFYTASALMMAAGVVPYLLSANASLSSIFVYALISLLFGAAIAVGQISARETEWGAWRPMRLLLGRQYRARAIYESLVWGSLWGGVLAAIPLAVRVSGWFPDANFGVIGWTLQTLHRAPALGSLEGIFDTRALATFGVLLPWLTKRTGVRWLSIVLFAAAAVALGFYGGTFISGPQAALAASALTFAVSLAIYLRLGLLALFAAVLASDSLMLAALLRNSANPFLQQQGLLLLALMAAGFAIALVAMRMGAELEPLDNMAARFLSQRERLKAEFSMAQQAQQRLLPAEAPKVPGFAVATACQPAKDVGGDLFDFFRLADGRFGFCVADVSGKGLPAALYMTLTKGLLAAASPEARSLADLARRVNRHLYIACKRKMFVTAAMAAVDGETRTLEYLRAGHNPALLLEKATGKARYLTTPGVGLGLAGPALFDRGARTEEFALSSGDVVVFYSDGVTEAMNEKLELYGEERFLATVERVGNRPAAEVLDAIRKDVSAFTGTEPAHDDITLLVLQTI